MKQQRDGWSPCFSCALVFFLISHFANGSGAAQEKDTAEKKSNAAAPRGSLVEDRAAQKLLEAGDARVDADELTKAVEVWQSVIERYPRSRIRHDAHMRLGNHFLQRERAYDRARPHFEAAAREDNRNEAQRAEATLKMGICHHETRDFGKAFKVFREVIEKFPVSPQVNHAYHYIGLAHFQLGHYSRAIDALEKVGTTLAGEDGKVEKVEAGKRLFVKIEDADLAALDKDQTVKVLCQTIAGDEETVACYPVGRNVRVVLGSIPTSLGKPTKNNGKLEVIGNDRVKVTYVDEHTADKKFNRPTLRDVTVVGEAVVEISDGAFRETLQGVVLGRGCNVQIVDADRDGTDAADTITALVEVLREKSAEELDAEAAARVAQVKSPNSKQPTPKDLLLSADEDNDITPVQRYKTVDRVEIRLLETPERRDGDTISEKTTPPAAPASKPVTPAPMPKGSEVPAPADTPNTKPRDPTIHTGVFRVQVPLVRAESAQADDILQALPGDWVQITYLDERHRGHGERFVTTKARCLEGNLGGVRVTRAEIADQELRLQTQLKTASALTNIGNRYKEFGLERNARDKYQQALAVCEAITEDARRLGGRLLEETYVQLWEVYFAMDKLDLAAAMCQRLQTEFPQSAFVDDALLQLADVARKQGDFQRAIGIYTRLVNMPTSQLRGDGQFGIAECYEAMAKEATGPAAVPLFDRAFQEYKKVFEGFPASGRVGEAVAKMANYYYQQKDFARAVDIFETVLTEHPDAKYLDVILFNYGRCLFRMNRRAESRKHFDQLIADFPESPLAVEAKKISEALAKAGF